MTTPSLPLFEVALLHCTAAIFVAVFSPNGAKLESPGRRPGDRRTHPCFSPNGAQLGNTTSHESTSLAPLGLSAVV